MKKINKPYIPFQNIRFCGAKTRTTLIPCKGSAMANGRCRFHGGKSTGRPITTGLFTKDAILEREKINQLLKETNKLLDAI